MTRLNGLRALVRGALDDVVGLAEMTTLDDVRRLLDLDDAPTTQARLGLTGRDVDAYSAVLPSTTGPDSPVQYTGGIWVHADGAHVVLVVGKDPHDDAGDPVTTPDLGEPDTRLDAAIGSLTIRDSELVHAGRGVALRIDPDDGQLMAVLLFEPTTVEDYVERVRPSAEPWRRLELPEREDWA